MLEFCDVMSNFYPKEIQKITEERIGKFNNLRKLWELKDDIWS